MYLVVFILVGGFITFSTILLFSEKPRPHKKELKLVHIIMRHGARAPINTYPKDPYINETFAPNGIGQLTNHGISELYNIGKELRVRYGTFLGDQFSNKVFYCQATGVDRTIASIQTVNAALWKPKNSQLWNEHLHWFPVPVHSEPLDSDMLLLVRKDCPQYNIELKKVENSLETLAELERFKPILTYIEESTGRKIDTFADVRYIYSTLYAEHMYGLVLPKWTKGYFPDLMTSVASKSYVLNAQTNILRRLKGGVLLKKILNDWKKKATGKLDTMRAYLYGGHDTTISNLLSALDIFDPQVPNFGMVVLLELVYDEYRKEYGVEIFVKNTTTALHHMQLPGCNKFCPLKDVVRLTFNVIPQDWEKECGTDDPNYEPLEQPEP